tara:strand:- start:333 stop:614 length:282 start_codon:yes stop_codon:yes gene_type:complete
MPAIFLPAFHHRHHRHGYGHIIHENEGRQICGYEAVASPPGFSIDSDSTVDFGQQNIATADLSDERQQLTGILTTYFRHKSPESGPQSCEKLF